eukprot:TRINITY_DN4003_c0_g1_i2.p1 TRINITY_DN4003_c0_g1~~TRINITY_DN4003_c0_g1_i2.p1  ORF type:complete len:422 (-),score=97.95 TRINITY_DN4003_c0_g1_i2:275-1540(-)
MECKINPHKGCCGVFVKAFKWTPVILISAIIIWSYYAYVVHLCIFSVQVEAARYILLILYHVIFLLFLWSYWRTVWTVPGKVPARYRLNYEQLEALENSESDSEQRHILDQIVIAKDLHVSMRTVQGSVRYCDRCGVIKPDRAHHCSVCGACVLKMDHHCPWVNNCVAFYNYKFFILFLFYGFFYCVYVALSSFKYFLQFWATSFDAPGQSKFHILFLFFVSSMFSLSLCSLLCYHIHLVINNRTTLEAFRAPVFRRGPDKKGFSLGRSMNLQEIFGDDWKVVMLPVFSSLGDGLSYPERLPDLEMGLKESERWDGEDEEENEERMPMLQQESNSVRTSVLLPNTESESEQDEDELMPGMLSASLSASHTRDTLGMAASHTRDTLGMAASHTQGTLVATLVPVDPDDKLANGQPNKTSIYS